jgi:hypothetical protein
MGLVERRRKMLSEKAHVHAFVPQLRGCPEAAHPLTLLVALKQKYDSKDFFPINQNIPPT